MAGLRKDVELIFRGEDRASPTIKSVRKNVADLSDAIEQNTRAAERGEGSVDDLAKSFRSLKDAQGDVNEIVKIATAYERMGQKLGEQNTKVTEAIAKHEALKAQIAATENPTKRLRDQFDASARAVSANAAKQEQYKAELLQLGAALDAAGGDSKSFAATQETIRQAAIETARALRDAAAAMDQFKGKQASGKANIAAADELRSFNALAEGSGLPQAQINFISTLENRLEALNAAIREDQASMAGLNRELADRAAADAAQRIRGMAAALDEGEAAARRMAAATGFRQMAAEIEAGARDITRFGAQADTSAASAQRLADAVQAILNPTQAAAGNLQHVNTILDQAEASVTGAKRRLSEYNDELNNLQAASAGITGIAKLIDDFRLQEAALAGAQRQFDAAQKEVIQLAQAMQSAEAPTEAMATDLQRAEANLERLGASLQKETTKLNQLEGALTKAGVDATALDAAQEALISSSQRLAAAQTKLRNTTRGRGSFLGLNPQEMTNLGFQINDIIVSLASGQKPLLVFAQQGAQIGQIIPGAFAKIVRFLPLLAVLAVVIGTIAGAFAKASQEAENLKIGEGLAKLGAGAGTSAAEFQKLAAQMDKIGVASEDIRGKLMQLSADGLSTAQMEQYIETAKTLADVTGVEAGEALDQLREHFQGGMDDIIALNAETGAYTETQLDLIQTLFDQGRADEARAEALRIYQAKQDEIANSQRGPWKTAVDQLSQAWQNFLSWLGNSAPFDFVRRQLETMAIGAAYVATILNQIASGNGVDLDAAAKIATGKVAAVSKRAAAPDPNRSTSGGRAALRDADRELRQAEAKTRVQREALVLEDAINEAAQKGLSTRETQLFVDKKRATFNATEDQKQEKRDAAAAKRGEAAARKRDAAAKRAAKAAEAEQNRIDNMEESILRSLESLDAKVAKGSTESLQVRLSAIDTEYQKLFRSIEEFADKTAGKGMIGDRTVEQAKAHVAAQKEALKNYATMEFFEDRIADIEKERAQKLDTIADQVARGILAKPEGLIESKAVIDEMAKKTAEMAQAGLAFALSIRTATPDPKLDALIAKFQNALQNNQGGQNQRAFDDVFTDQIEKAEANLNQILSQRNSLIDLENLKVEMGLQTRRQAQTNIEQHYARTRGLILEHIDQIEAMARAYSGALTPDMQAYFDSLRARIAGVKIEAAGVDASFTSLKGKIDALLTSNIVGFIDSMAQSFADLALGKGDVMDFLESIGLAFLKMIAQILQTVATLIIEALILDAVDKATGGILKPLLQIMAATATFHEGGVVGDQGSSKRTKNVSPLLFANAPRYHSGGIAGLAPNEMTAVLKKGEEVLTEDNPRHINNGGGTAGAQGAGRPLRQVLAIGDNEIANAMAGSAGEDVTLTHIRRNKATLREILEIS